MMNAASSTRRPGSRWRPVSLAKRSRSGTVSFSPIAAINNARQLRHDGPGSASPKSCRSARACRMGTLGIMCVQSPEIVPQARRYVARLSLQADRLIQPARGVAQRRKQRWVDRLTGKPTRPKVFKHRAGQRSVANDLLLSSGQPLSTAEIGLDALDRLGGLSIGAGAAIQVFKRLQ